MADVQYRLDAGHSRQTAEQTNRLLSAVSEIQLRFIRGHDARSGFAQTLQTFLDFTDSEYGFIGSVHHDTDGLPRLQIQACSSSGDNASKEFYETSLPDGLQIIPQEALTGETLRTGKLLISNTPTDDVARSELPAGHPPLTSFMTIPLRIDDQFLGIVGVANRPGGYEVGLVDWLEPLCTTCATLIIATNHESTITEPVRNDEVDQRIRRTGQSETFEEVLEHVDGQRRFLTTQYPWRGRDGEIIGVIDIARDITEWKKTQSALRESRERLQAIIESTPECVKLVAADGTLLEMNAAGLRMIEADSAEGVIGKNIFSLITPECLPAFIVFHNDVCSGTPGSIQYEITGCKGTRRWIETHATPLRLEAENEVVHLAITRDITAARKAEETIAQQHAQLLHVSRLSSMGQMVAVISHEITQPLAAISNFAAACALLTQQPTPDHRKLGEYLASITEQSIRAGQILGRVRDFVRRTDDHRSSCHLNQLVTDSLSLVKADLRSRQVTVEFHYPDEAIFVLADSVQIQQVIVNLISNACDAMDAQPVDQRRITISLTHTEELAAVEILDSGPGLTQEIKSRLFEPFYTSKNNGMGMGLTICRDIIRSHSGTIAAENIPNVGARFRFTLPRSTEATDELATDALSPDTI